MSRLYPSPVAQDHCLSRLRTKGVALAPARHRIPGGGFHTLLEISHTPWLALAALAIALMAGFTGLSLTQGASRLAIPARKARVSMAAVALGGGIWSMHFVAMLGMRLPVQFFYDPLITLISALTAILMAGLALLLLHFRPRTAGSRAAAGAILGLGIAGMHFSGMSGMEICRPVNAPLDYILATAAAMGLSVLVIHVAYGTRTDRTILWGTICFGAAVVAVHYIAIALTGFEATGLDPMPGPGLSNQSLAIGVTLAAFLICAAFLLTGISFVAPDDATAPEAPRPEEGRRQEPELEPGTVGGAMAQPSAVPPAQSPPPDPAPIQSPGIPYERDGRTHFAEASRVAALRAEGHYSLLYMGHDKLFCPWSISTADTRLRGAGFLRVHRSFLVNPTHVTGFEQGKDKGALFFERTPALPKVPVSRARLAPVRDALGL